MNQCSEMFCRVQQSCGGQLRICEKLPCKGAGSAQQLVGLQQQPSTRKEESKRTFASCTPSRNIVFAAAGAKGLLCVNTRDTLLTAELQD
jgi:hypothetical protein